MRTMSRLLQSLVLIIFLPLPAFSQVVFGNQLPSVDKVFTLTPSRVAGGDLKLHWTIGDGNYLYRDSLEATVDGKPFALQAPPAVQKDDPNFGTVEVYHRSLDISAQAQPPGTLTVTYRGCAEAGICYPPVSKSIDLQTLKVTPVHAELDTDLIAQPKDVTRQPPQTDGATLALAGSVEAMALAFLGFGILLAFTPCVFPMIPILSAMLAGAGGSLSPVRSFVLSGSYVLAMAVAYGFVGLAAGWSGTNVQIAMQSPWLLGLSGLIFVALALSMFGFYELALPSGLTARFSRPRSGGSILGAMTLGFGSALIVSPCVTPPLAAAALYGLQTGDAARGASALFFLGLGMGLPLIAFGTLGPRFLPKSGIWLEKVRGAFGFVFLAIAIMLVTRVLPATIGMALWGVFAIGLGVFAGGFDRMYSNDPWNRRISKAGGLVAALYGAILIVGFAGGGADPLRPLAFSLAPAVTGGVATRDTQPVASNAALDSALAALPQGGKPALVSFTADWCTACKSNEAVLSSPDARHLLADLPVIIADVTAQSAAERALMSRFDVVGPPTMFLLDKAGVEKTGSRLVGPITADDISKILAGAGT